MAIKDLKRFMVERMLDLDPTLSESEGSLMFIKVIDPLLKRIGTDPVSLDIESFIISRIADEYPELDVRTPGSALRDVMVAPLVMILEPLRREIFFLRAQQSLANAPNLNEPEMDAILSNVLSIRNSGTEARGTVRVFFNSPRTFAVDGSILFSTATGITFKPEFPKTFFKENFLRSGKHWYVDISVSSTEPDVLANVPKNTIKFVTGLTGVARVTNPAATSGGVTKETNEDFLTRAERSLSERSLNTKRGIETDLYNQFSDLITLSVIGHGEPEMQRDILMGEPNIDLSESIGDLVYMTMDWATIPLVSEGLGTTGSSLVFPFTNTFVLKAPTGGWSAEEKEEIKAARFVRIADGNQFYTNKLLGRVRVVDSVEEHMSGDLYVRVRDFEIYPRPTSIFDKFSVNPMNVYTSTTEHGLNVHSKQGSDYKLIGSSEGVDYVIGAHLPFTDHITTDFAALDVPASIIPGRDFLVMGSQEGPQAPTHLHPFKLEIYPLLDHYGVNDLGIARKDSFLTSKDRVLYKGEDNFAYDPDIDYAGMREYVKIYEFGGPKLTALADEGEAVAYSGVDYESHGRRPGVALEGKLVGKVGSESAPDPVAVIAPAAEAYECDLVLHSSQPAWALMNIEAGHYVSCTAYPSRYALAADPNSFYTYDGNVADSADIMQWQAWGRVKAVGFGDPWRLRVEGMDWTNLEEFHINEFSPQAQATVTIEKPFDIWKLASSPWNVGAEVHLFSRATITVPSWSGSLEIVPITKLSDEGSRGHTPVETPMTVDINELALAADAAFTPVGVAAADVSVEIWVKDHYDNTIGENVALANLTGGFTKEGVAAALDDAKVELAQHLSLQSGDHIATLSFDTSDEDKTLLEKIVDGGGAAYADAADSQSIILHSIFYAAFTENGEGDSEREHKFVNIVFRGTDPGTGTDVLVKGTDHPDTYVTETGFVGAASPSPTAMCKHVVTQINSVANPFATYFSAEVERPIPEEADTDYASAPCAFTVNSVYLGNDGNGGHIWISQDNATSPEEEPEGYITLPIWNGSYVSDGSTGIYGNINGGFSGGFGPQRQVVGKERIDTDVHVAPPPFGSFEEGLGNVLDPEDSSITKPSPTLPFLDDDSVYGDQTPYELLSTMVAEGVSPSEGQVAAKTSVLTFTLANTPVAYPLLVGDSPTVRLIMEMVLPNRDKAYVDPGTGGSPAHRVRLIIEDDGDGNLSESLHWDNAVHTGQITYDLSNSGNSYFLDMDGENEINYATGQCRLTFKEPSSDGTDPGIVVSGWYTDGSDLEIGSLKPLYSDDHAGATIKFYAAYTYIFSPYRLFWTVYRGMTEMLSPDGVVLPSWDEFQFAPAYKNPSLDLGSSYAPIHAPFTAQFFGNQSMLGMGPGASATWESAGDCTSLGAVTYAYSARAIGTSTPIQMNDMKAVWIRLNKPFNLEHHSVGGTPSEACLSASVVDLGGAVSDGDESARRTNYSAKRYRYEKDISTDPESGSDESVLVQPLSLPMVSGSVRIDDVDQDNPELDLDVTSLSNVQGHSGFLIPHPMGKDYDTHFTAPSAHPATTWTDSTVDLLENQVVQLFNAHPSTVDDVLITVSDMPGSTPFPLKFGAGVLVANNEVHIGGMTDVYVKATGVTNETSAPILLQPEDPSALYEDGGDILISAEDGVINPSIQATHFYSAELSASLTSAFGDNPRPLDNLVLEILDSPSSELQPTHFRIIHSVAGGVKIDGEFPQTLGAGFEEVRFRVMRECSTSLTAPLIVYKKGTDLIVKENSTSVYSPSGYNFSANPETTTLFLRIDSYDENQGEYLIKGINLNNLILEKAIPKSATGVSYRIYSKQGVGLTFPMVRVKGVELSDGDVAGVTVPYKHPVDVVSSDFTGLNDDPNTQATFGIDGGQLSSEAVDLDADGVLDTDPETETDLVYRACFTVPNEINLAEYGVALYDVLRLDDMDEDLRYWYVEAITDGLYPVSGWKQHTEQFKVTAEHTVYTDLDVDLTSEIAAGDVFMLDNTPGQGVYKVKSVTYIAGSWTSVEIDPLADGYSNSLLVDWGVGHTLRSFHYRSVGKNNKLVLNKDVSLEAATGDLAFTLGHPSVGTGTIYFRDKTFFMASPETVFTYVDPETDKKLYLRPSPAERAEVYRSGTQTTDIRITNDLLSDAGDPDVSTRVLESTYVDFFAHGIQPGDKLQVLSKVIWSNVFRADTDGSVTYEEDKNLMLGGKTMAALVNGALRTCTFSGPNPMTLDDVVADINRQMGDVLLAENVEFDPEGTPGQYVIKISSSNDVTLVTQGSIGILEQEGLRFLDQRDNTPDPRLIREYTVSKLDYVEPVTDPATLVVTPAKYRIYLTKESTYGSSADGKLREYMDLITGGIWGSPDGGATPGIKNFEEVFIEVYREKHQNVFPIDLKEDATGLYYAVMRLTSYDPNVTGGIVPDDTQLSVESYQSLGYEIDVANTNYSYSLGEESSLRVTSIVLSEAANSFERVYEVAGSSVTVDYDRSGLVNDVQNYLLDKNYRVVCNNPLARHYFPAYPMISVVRSGGKLSDSDFKQYVSEYLASLYPNKPLELFDLLSVFTRRGATFVNLPQEAAFLVHGPDRKISVVRDKNIVTLGNQYHIMEDLSRVKVNGS